MNVAMIGDIVGGPGRRAFAQVVTRLKQNGEVGFVVANAENAAGGRGLTRVLAAELLAAGADVITLGDHAWDQKDLAAFLDQEPRVIRPANFPQGCPGRGCVTVAGPGGTLVTVINLVGRVFMGGYADCPFRTADALLRQEAGPGRTVLVDFHGEATSEKVVMGRYLDGRVTAVAGTHTHVQTSDEGLLPKGTAYITDLGMTGPKDSALGRDLASVTTTMLTGMPARFEVAEKDLMLEGMLLRVDPSTGRALSVRRLRERAV